MLARLWNNPVVLPNQMDHSVGEKQNTNETIHEA